MAQVNNALYSPYGAYELKASYQRNFFYGTLSVLSFVLLTVALAQPLLHGFKWRKFNVRQMFYLVAVAIILEGVDIGLKITLGPHNQSILHRVMEEAANTAAFIYHGIPLVS